MTSEPVPPPVAEGTVIGPYRIDTSIGAGGMGVVYRAVDTKFNRPVAIKFLSGDFGDAVARQRFQREAQTASSLNHPQILTVHDVGEFEGRQYLVTELIDGGTLRAWGDTGTRSWRQIAELLVGVADGLAVAHAAGVIHRDIKPENVLLTKHGYAKLTDFGLAKLLESPANDVATRSLHSGGTRVGAVIGTLAYMSPEQVAGKTLDARSDIFSFGVVLYELLSGRQPFIGSTELEILRKVQHQTPEPLESSVPATLRMVVEKAMDKDPAERYQTMQELVLDLRRHIRQSNELELPASPKRSYGLYVAAAVVVAAAAAGLWWRSGTARTPSAQGAGIRSILVLPLQNLSRDPDQEFFSDGMTEALITSLAQLQSVDVISRTSVMRLKGTTKRPPEIGREFGVDAIVEGSVQRAGGRVRITAQLVRASTDTHVWARDFERDATDVLALQAEVARTIAQEIQVKLTPEQSKRLSQVRPMNAEALDAYLLGRYHFWKQTEPELKQAITYFERAIALQPDYAEAYAGLSDAWGTLIDFGLSQDNGVRRSAAVKAVELDPNLSDAHAALASVALEDWDWENTDREFRRALELNPDSINACACHGNALAAWGRLSEAIALDKHAEQVNPLSAYVQFNYGFVLFMARRQDEAIAHFKRAIELDPGYRIAYLFLAEGYNTTGRSQEAVAILDRPEFQGGTSLGLALARAGRRRDATEIADRFRRTGVDPYGVGRLLIALGDVNSGLDQLTTAYDKHLGPVRWNNVDPMWDEVRSNPRFQALVARLKLPAAVTH